MRAAPCLQSVHVKILNKHMLECISKNHSEVKTLFYEHIEEDVEETYKLLKLQIDDINKNIELKKKSFWFNEENMFSIDPIFWRKDS